jgi:hypothetical protein
VRRLRRNGLDVEVPFDVDAILDGNENRAFRPGARGSLRTLAEFFAEEVNGASESDAWFAQHATDIQRATTYDALHRLLEGWHREVRVPWSRAAFDREEAEKQREYAAAVEAMRKRREAIIRSDPGPVADDDEHGRNWVLGKAGGSRQESAITAPLYHATMAGKSIMRTGLKAREDLRVPGPDGYYKGTLGGGREDTVSVVLEPSGAFLIAAALAAINEAHVNGDAVLRWFDENWGPIIASSPYGGEVEREMRNAPAAPAPRLVRYLNKVSMFVGLEVRDQYPQLNVPWIMTVPGRVDPGQIGVIKLYAHVDVLYAEKRRVIVGGIGAGESVPGVRIVRPVGGRHGELRTEHDGSRRLSWLGYANVAESSENKSEHGEIRVTPESTTVVGFAPMTDWRSVLKPTRTNRGRRR